jgi:hypothetical protein
MCPFVLQTMTSMFLVALLASCCSSEPWLSLLKILFFDGSHICMNHGTNMPFDEQGAVGVGF